MNRFNQIVESIKAAGTSKLTVADLGLEAQVTLAYQCARSAYNSAQWWLAQTASATSELRFNEAMGCLPGLFGFLEEASHITEAVDSRVPFEDVQLDAQINVASTPTEDRIIDEVVGVKRKPHAWARDKLIASGIWPMAESEDPDEDVGAEHFKLNDHILWFNLDKIADRELGRYIGSMVLAHASDKVRDTHNDGKLLEIITQSPLASEIAHIANPERKLLKMQEISKKSTPYVDNVPVAPKTIMAAWQRVLEDDEDDAINEEMHATSRSIKALAREAKLLSMINDHAQRMADNGISADLVDFFKESSLAKLAA